MCVYFDRKENCPRAQPLELHTKQGDFLMRLGIVSRIERYIEKHNPSGEDMKNMLDSLEKLVASDMGSRFKVMALLPENIKTSPGFD